MQLEWGWGDGGTSVQELGVWWGFLCPRVSAQKTSVGSTWGWTESLPGAGSALHRWTLLNKLPLHNKLPLNHSIEGVSSSCQRAGIIQEKTTGERRGLKQNFFLKDFNFIYDFFPIARKLSGACLAPDLIRLPPSSLALFSSQPPTVLSWSRTQVLPLGPWHWWRQTGRTRKEECYVIHRLLDSYFWRKGREVSLFSSLKEGWVCWRKTAPEDLDFCLKLKNQWLSWE